MAESESQHPARRSSEFVRFILADADGMTFEIAPDNFERCPIFVRVDGAYAHLRLFVSNELAQRPSSGTPPKHIAYMQGHDLVDYCDVSEKGHYKWYPKGLLIQKLLLDYASRIAQEWGAFEVKNPLVIRGDNNVVGQLMGEFHERDYVVDGGRGVCYLRYASDPLAFPFLQKVQFSYKQSPLKVYEEASCFRNEQQGEVSGLKRVRNFLMTDMHAACSSVEQARSEFEWLCRRFAGLMNDVIAKGRWVLGWEGTIDFYEQNKDWLVGISRSIGVPAFFKLMPRMSHYYAIKNEYQAICEDGSNVQVSTVQWDVKDGPRFDIGFVDENGCKQPCPVILHASSFGSIERALCAILENIAIDARSGQMPMYPLWLAPTQVRVLPVSAAHVPAAVDLCERLASQSIRADVDDRDGTVGRKIRDGEKEWIPYLAVFGDREVGSGRLAVRIREDGRQEEMSADDLVQAIRRRTGNMPHRSLPLPALLSRRPIFGG
jgi:threonyl-tRNA synthetase